MSLVSSFNFLTLKSDDWSDLLLPPAIYESKQIVNSKIFAGALIFGSFCFLVTAIVIYNLNINDKGVDGQKAFLFFSGIMDFSLIVLIPSMIYHNLSIERSNGCLELLSITYMKPLKIILGKWQSGLLQLSVFGSIVLPGIFFSYLFNNISISAILICLLITIFISQFNVVFSIFLCCLCQANAMRKILQLISMISSLLVLLLTYKIKEIITTSDDFIVTIFNLEFVLYLLSFLIFMITIELLFFALSTARLSFYTSNKSTAPRIFYCIILFEVLLFILINNDYIWYTDNFLKYFLSVNSFFTLFFLLEKDTLPKKIFAKYHKKQGAIRKFFKLLFYPGRSNAYLLFCLQTVIIFIFFAYAFREQSYPEKYHLPNLIAITCRDILSISCVYLFYQSFLKKYPRTNSIRLFFIGIAVLVVLAFAPLKFFPAIVISALIASMIAFMTATNRYLRKEEKIRNYIGGERGEI